MLATRRPAVLRSLPAGNPPGTKRLGHAIDPGAPLPGGR
jgi:hypothetical protein